MPFLLPLLLSVALSPQLPDPGNGPVQEVELRVFNGADEVTRSSVVKVFRAGDRNNPVASFEPGQKLVIHVPPGYFDIQAVQQNQGQVVGVRWAEQVLVQNYPDEAGKHLEIVNLKRGFGALQVRTPATGSAVSATVAAIGSGKDTGAPTQGDGYLLWIVPPGDYDVHLHGAGSAGWAGVTVRADRTTVRVAQAETK